MKNKILITGGAGFIGSNLACYFLNNNQQVTIFDNFERKGTGENAQWLKNKFFRLEIIKGDIRSRNDLQKAVQDKDIIMHLAAQVAVTSSVINPTTDFDINALGTFNLLEAVRQSGHKPIILFASTNKVYGGMENVQIVEKKSTYEYQDLPYGVSEKQNLDFHSPYGCSKGCADQYMRDYARIYDLPTVVFRQSCIYGPRQFGVEDQGWVAWFIIALHLGIPITVYGDGKQVRDILYITDLVRLFDMAVKKIDIAKGKIYNVGGGISNTISVWGQFGPILERLFRRKIKINYSDWRPGDQKIYISDIRLVEEELGWKPEVRVATGIKLLYEWADKNKSMLKKYFT